MKADHHNVWRAELSRCTGVPRMLQPSAGGNTNTHTHTHTHTPFKGHVRTSGGEGGRERVYSDEWGVDEEEEEEEEEGEWKPPPH